MVTVMTSISIMGLVAIGITLGLGFAIRFYTKCRLDDLDGFQGVIDLDELAQTEEEEIKPTESESDSDNNDG